VNNQPSPTLLLIVVIFLVLLEFSRYKWILKWFTSRKTSGKTPKPYVMKPRSEKDCPDCRKTLALGDRLSSTCTHVPQSWNEIKSKRGRKKTICTQHQFCSNPDCDYYLIVDENIHALVGYGTHGKYEDIQDLLCQAVNDN